MSAIVDHLRDAQRHVDAARELLAAQHDAARAAAGTHAIDELSDTLVRLNLVRADLRELSERLR